MSLPQPWECASEVTDIVRTDRQGTPHACPCDGYGEKLLQSNRAAAEPIPLMTPGRKYKVPVGSHVKCVPKASPLSSVPTRHLAGFGVSAPTLFGAFAAGESRGRCGGRSSSRRCRRRRAG